MMNRDFPAEIDDTARHIEQIGLHYDAKTLRDAASAMRSLLERLRDEGDRMLGQAS